MEEKKQLRRLQLIEADLVEALQEVCRRHGLRYWLYCGSMIGAVRHRGAIPWDDDTDVGMPRPDYERLLANWRQWMPRHIRVISPRDDPWYPFTFAKMVDRRTTIMEQPWYDWLDGAYVDIFPVDGTSRWAPVRAAHYALWVAVYRLLFFRTRPAGKHGGGWRDVLPSLLRRVSTPQRLQRLQTRIASHYAYDKADRVMGFRNGWASLVRREVMGQGTPVEYEGRQLMGPDDAHAYLTRAYGDYMTLPPEDRRHIHRFYFIDLDTPFETQTADDIRRRAAARDAVIAK